ncbi:sodium/glutamate symporter [Mycolicibacterium elephantis]|uniref:sodium/glutamate symporter n=1 Tax=Mycolicibacterium elephantis TaxID=81858 RepID=UPI001F25F985|nr:sodium/glutamate symporter [Mycolicibacterium elephantis]
MTDAQTIGLSLVILGVIFAVGWTVRGRIRLLRSLFIPSSIIAGFLVLLLGPQVLGRLTGTSGVFPSDVIDVWRVMPGLMINVVFGAIMIGKTLPAPRKLWRAASPHALLGIVLSLGQFTLGGMLVLFVLTPVFGLAPEAGALLEMSFAGGHGTIAGMGQLLADVGAPELVDVGLGLATISMITGVVVGSALVRWAVRSPKVEVMRNAAPTAAEDYDIDRIRIAPADQRPVKDEGIHATTLAFALIAMAILLAVALLWSARAVVSALGSDILDTFPLFPVAVIGGFVVQWVMTSRPRRQDRQGSGAGDLRGRAGRAVGVCHRHDVACDNRFQRSGHRRLHCHRSAVERRDHGVARPAVPPNALVRAHHRGLRTVARQCRDGIRTGRHGRPAAADQHRQRLWLQTTAVRAVLRRRSAHGAVGTADCAVRPAGFHHRKRRAASGFRRVGDSQRNR